MYHSWVGMLDGDLKLTDDEAECLVEYGEATVVVDSATVICEVCGKIPSDSDTIYDDYCTEW